MDYTFLCFGLSLPPSFASTTHVDTVRYGHGHGHGHGAREGLGGGGGSAWHGEIIDTARSTQY